MKVPFFDVAAQLALVGEDVKRAVCAVIESGQYILGPECERLEREIASAVGVPHAVGVSSGTDALLVSLMALGVGPGDTVVTTPYSFFATAGVIARLGATPAFVDIDPGTYNLDGDALRDWFARRGRGKRAIIPVHLFGQCADMDAVLEVAAHHEAAVVEDAAQALGAVFVGEEGSKKAGAMGTFGCLSFFPSKNLGAIGDGGMVLTHDEVLAAKVRMLRAQGASARHHHSLIGGNFRLDAVQAAALLVKLRHLSEWQSARQARAAYYDERITSAAVRKPAVFQARSCHVYNQYVISVAERRDELREHLRRHDIGHEVYYPRPFHEQPCFAHLGYRRGDFPQSEHAAAHTLALPIYPELTPAMQDRVIECLESFYA